MLGLKLLFGRFRGNACYHVATVPNEWLSTYPDTYEQFHMNKSFFRVFKAAVIFTDQVNLSNQYYRGFTKFLSRWQRLVE